MSLGWAFVLIFLAGVIGYQIGWHRRGRNRYLAPPDPRTIVKNSSYY